VQVRPWTVDDPLVPPAVASRARQSEQPEWLDVGGKRVLVLAVEPAGAHEAPERDHPHLVLVAEAPAVTWIGSVGPFLVGYSLVALSIAVALSMALIPILGAAVGPLRRAADRIDAIRGLDHAARTPVEGPEEVQRLTQAVNDLMERLSVAHEAQRRFTAEAAHELRTPVAVVLGELELALKRDRTPEEYQTALLASHRATRRLSDLVEALLTLARIDAGQAAQDRIPVWTADLIAEAVNLERKNLEQAGCSLDVDIQGSVVVQVQPALATTALSNLLRNSAVHAAGGPVTVRALTEPGRALLRVEDRGPGLPPGEPEALFERFQRSDRRRVGLGLGLPLAREVARRHGGDVWLENRAGGGIIATLSLPAP
jgi:signal transduction histidine kinase